jgi:putative membrane protein
MMMMMMMGFGLIVVLLLIGVVAAAVGWRPQSNQMGSDQTTRTPLEIVKARYARGEISREEYDQVRMDLQA